MYQKISFSNMAVIFIFRYPFFCFLAVYVFPVGKWSFFEWIDPPGASLSRRSPVEGEENMKSGND